MVCHYTYKNSGIIIESYVLLSAAIILYILHFLYVYRVTQIIPFLCNFVDCLPLRNKNGIYIKKFMLVCFDIVYAFIHLVKYQQN